MGHDLGYDGVGGFDSKSSSERSAGSILATVLSPCRIILTFHSRPDGEALEQECLAEVSVVSGSLDIHFREEHFSNAYSLILSANDEEFLHAPLLGPTTSPDDHGTVQNQSAPAMRGMGRILIRDPEPEPSSSRTWLS